jgi:hypothetical protein
MTLSVVAIGLASAIVVMTGLALTGPLLPRNPGGEDVPESPSPSAATQQPAWSPDGPLPACGASGPAGGPDEAPVSAVDLVREIETRGSRVGRPGGITYSPEARLLLLFPEGPADAAPPRESVIGLVSLFGDAAGSTVIDTPVAEPSNVAFDGVGHRLLIVDPEGRLLSVPASASGDIAREPDGIGRFDVRPLDMGQLGGAAADPTDGALYLLDLANARVVRIGADPTADGGREPALRDGGVCTFRLVNVPDNEPRGLAIDPGTGNLFVFGTNSRRLYELSGNGELLAVHDVAPIGLGVPSAMVFAPSGDPTDDDAATSLYLVDQVGGSADGGDGRERLVELRLETPGVAGGPTPTSDIHGILERTIETFRWSPVSPDPSGLAYVPDEGIIVSDAEVDETDAFRGVNVFASRPDGTLEGTYVTPFTREPAGLAVDPGGDRRFVSDDLHRRIYEVRPGPDTGYGTTDDDVRVIETTPFGSYDPEGLAFGQGRLFIADGLGAEIFSISPGPNGEFDGVAPGGDDEVSHFDTLGLGQPTPEGIEFLPGRGTLLVVSNDRRANLLEVSTAGEAVRVIDLSFLNAIAPGGLAAGPGSRPGATSIYIADRGIDNAADPRENDGRVYEIRLAEGPPPNLVVNSDMELDANRDGAVDGWDDEPGVEPSRTTAHAGRTSLQLSAGTDQLVTGQDIPSIAENRVYTFAAWVNIPPTDTSFTFKARIRWQGADGATIVSDRFAVMERSTAGWDRIAATVRSPANATSARIGLTLVGGGSVVYVDEVLFVPVGSG